MSALTFNPWATLKGDLDPDSPPNPANSPNPCGEEVARLGGLAGLGGESPTEGEVALAVACDALSSVLAGRLADPEVQADRAAIMADGWPAGAPARTEPPADLVERLAGAMAQPKPWQHITDRERAMSHFMADARRRLAALDPLARGLLVQAEEAKAVSGGEKPRINGASSFHL